MNLRKVLKDFGIPIKVIPNMENTIELFDPFFNIKETLEKVLEEVNTLEEQEISLEEEIKVAAKAFKEYFNNNEDYLKFLGPWNSPSIPNFGLKLDSIYSPYNNNKDYISIDLVKANFQVFRHLGIIKEANWDTFASGLSRSTYYVLKAKRYRQVLFGQLSGMKRNRIYQRLMTSALYKEIIREYLNIKEVYVSDDELIIHHSSDIDLDNIKKIADLSGDEWRVNTFTLRHFSYSLKDTPIGDFYINQYPTEIKVKKYEGIFLPQILRYLKREVLGSRNDYDCEADLEFMAMPQVRAKLKSHLTITPS